jgi:hypothetical protein
MRIDATGNGLPVSYVNIRHHPTSPAVKPHDPADYSLPPLASLSAVDDDMKGSLLRNKRFLA